MLPMPTKFNLVAGSSEGSTLLNAFDGALLAAGAGNLNLVRVSSVLPPDAVYDESLYIPPGNLVPVAYGATDSNESESVISAAVGVGIPDDDSFGMIMEVSGKFDKNHAEKQVKQMIVEAFKMRNKTLAEIKIKAIEHKVEKIGCVFAGVLLWY